MPCQSCCVASYCCLFCPFAGSVAGQAAIAADQGQAVLVTYEATTGHLMLKLTERREYVYRKYGQQGPMTRPIPARHQNMVQGISRPSLQPSLYKFVLL